MSVELLSLISLLVVISLVNFVIQRNRILISLLSLEAATLNLALLSTLSLSFNIDMFICLVILTLGAAEARIALALLASITQRFGSDMIKSLSINKCSGNNLIKIFALGVKNRKSSVP